MGIDLFIYSTEWNVTSLILVYLCFSGYFVSFMRAFLHVKDGVRFTSEQLYTGVVFLNRDQVNNI